MAAGQGFNYNTRRQITQLADYQKPTGGGRVDIPLPKVGLLALIFLAIRGTIAGTLTAPNALGMASVVRGVRLQINGGYDIFNMSGPGYHHLWAETWDTEQIFPVGQSNARSAVTAAAFNLDMVIPIAVNLRDPVGMINLQTERSQMMLSVDFETDGNVATGATITSTVTPYLVWFAIPNTADPNDMPNLRVIHSLIEDRRVVSGAGDYAYEWPRGPQYMKLIHGYGIGVSGSDAFSKFALRINQNNYLQNTDPKFLDLQFRAERGRARPAGGIYLDFVASSGLGNYGLVRDFINSAATTDIFSVITTTGGATLYAIREQLLMLGSPDIAA